MMTPEQEKRGAEMFAAGASEREVAAELGCSASTAHRLRERLDGGRDATERPAEDDAEAELASAVDEAVQPELIAQVTEKREELAASLADLEARAQASRDAITALEAERLRLIGEGKDAAPLRPRMASARDDLADWETAVGFAQQSVAQADARIAELRAAEDLARIRAELAAAVAERDRVYAASGDRQRAAVGAVAAAAAEFTAALSDEDQAQRRVTGLTEQAASLARQFGEPLPEVPGPVSTAIGVPVDQTYGYGPPLALLRALMRAREGNVAAVAELLGKVNGWLPPGPPTAEELEAARALAADRERQLAELKARQAAGPGALPSPWHGPVEDIGPDRVPPEFSVRKPLPPTPWDMYRYPAGGGGGAGYRTGW